MNNKRDKIIRKVSEAVKNRLEGAEGGHDWWHVYRVWQNAKTISQSEPVNIFVVELAALLHDIGDPKFHKGDEEVGPRIAREILADHNIEKHLIEKIINIVRGISFKNSFDPVSEQSIELQVVQDADRLDAIGAIGIARTFNYGGYRDRTIYNPEIKPEDFKSSSEYKKSKSPTINHFYEKLLLLKDKMNTEMGKKMAIGRHKFLEEYLERFFKEWNGSD